MKITAIKTPPVFGKGENNTCQKSEYKDPLASWPLRGLGYTNDIGVAINEIAPNAARLFWVPALMYFGADIYDKYKNQGNTYNPDGKRAFSQAAFQAFASIIFPTVFGHVGQSSFSYFDKFNGAKLTTNSKEQVLRFIKNHAAERDLFNEQYSKSEIIENFKTNFDNFYLNSKHHYNDKNIFSKIYDVTLDNCKKSAIPLSNPERLKAYAIKKFEEVIDVCKTSNALKENIDKQIFKLKAWKSAGAFTAILLTFKLVDDFVEKIIIKKFVEPQMQMLGEYSYRMKDFLNSRKQEPKSIYDKLELISTLNNPSNG